VCIVNIIIATVFRIV